MKFPVDMTYEQLQSKVGSGVAKDMSRILRGQTGEIRDGRLFLYSYDLQKAHNIVMKDANCTKEVGGEE